MTFLERAALVSVGIKANKMPCDDFYGTGAFRIDGNPRTTRGITTFIGKAYYIDNIAENYLKTILKFSMSAEGSPPGGLMAVSGKDSAVIQEYVLGKDFISGPLTHSIQVQWDPERNMGKTELVGAFLQGEGLGTYVKQGEAIKKPK